MEDDKTQELDSILSALEHDSWTKRLSAVRALSEILSEEMGAKNRRTVARALIAAGEDEKWEVRKAVVAVLASPHLPLDERVDDLLRDLRQDSNKWVRQAAHLAAENRRKRRSASKEWPVSREKLDPLFREIAKDVRNLDVHGTPSRDIFKWAVEIGERHYRQLGADTAHELRTVLTPIQGFASELKEYLAKTGKGDQSSERYVERILANAEFLSRFVDDIEEYTSENPPEKESVKLGIVIDDALEAGRGRVGYEADSGPRISYRIDVPDDLVVNVFPLRLTRALANLIANAYQAMGDGGTLSIRAESTDSDSVTVIIRDTGTGMVTEDMEVAFERFRTTRRSQGGTGLGLPIAKRIIEEHEGQLELSSQPGEGTAVTIELPGMKMNEEE